MNTATITEFKLQHLQLQKDYPAWSRQFQRNLGTRPNGIMLIDVLNGSTRPVKTESTEPEIAKEHEKLLATWTAVNFHLVNYIGANVEETVNDMLARTTKGPYASQLWEALKVAATSNTATGHYAMLEQLVTMRQNRMPIRKHAHKFFTLATTLRDTGHAPSKSRLLAMFTRTLDEMFFQVTDGLMHDEYDVDTPEHEAATDKLTEKLLKKLDEIEARHASKKRANDEASRPYHLQVEKQVLRAETKTKKTKAKIRCNNCNKLGHYKKDCKSPPKQSTNGEDRRPKRKKAKKNLQTTLITTQIIITMISTLIQLSPITEVQSAVQPRTPRQKHYLTEEQPFPSSTTRSILTKGL